MVQILKIEPYRSSIFERDCSGGAKNCLTIENLHPMQKKIGLLKIEKRCKNENYKLLAKKKNF